MADYNLGTASGRIVVDGSPAELGFNVAKTAAGAFFDVVKMRVSEVQQFGRRLAAAGAAGATGLGAAIKTAADFEQSMSGVYAVANANEEQMDSLREKAMQLGADTVYSASEAALALEELVKAGISVEDVLNGSADAAVALAAAGGIGIPEAATIAANAMNQFGLSAKEVPRVADILAGVANTSAADVSSLGQSLSQAGAVANLAGLSFKDTAIALGEMADAGINGSDAGTSLKTMLNNLIPTTVKQKNLFKELGLLSYDLGDANKALAKITGDQAEPSIAAVKDRLADYVHEMGLGTKGTQKNAAAVDELLSKYGGLNNQFFDSQGNVKNLVGLQGELGNALKGMTREQKLASLETLFGADAMRASAILSLAGAKGYRKFAADVEKTKAADVAKVRLDNLNGAVEQMKGSLETAAISVGSVFLPVITKIVQGITWLVNAFNGLPGSIKTAIAIILAIFSAGSLLLGLFLAFLPVIVGMVANFLLLRAISTVTGGFRVFFATLRAGQGAMVAFQAGIARTVTGMNTLAGRTLFTGKVMLMFGRMARAAWIMATGPIGIIVLAVLALIAVGVLLYKKWTPFRNLIDSIAAVLKEKFLAAWTALKPVLADAGRALVQAGKWIGQTLLPVLKQVGTLLMGTLMEGWNSIKEAVVSNLLPALKGLGETLSNDVGPALQKLGGLLAPIATAILKVWVFLQLLYLKGFLLLARVIIAYVLPVLIKFVGFILNEVIKAVVMLVEGIIGVVTGIIKVFDGLIKFVTGVFTGNWGKAWEGVKEMASGIWDLIVGIVKIALSVGILKALSLGFRLIVALVRVSWRFVLTLFQGAMRLMWNIIRTGFNLVVNIIRGAAMRWLAMVRRIWTMIVGAVRGSVRAVWNVIKSVFSSIGNVISGAARAWWNTVKNAFKTIYNAAKAGMVRMMEAVRSGVDKVLNFFQELPGKIVDALSRLMSVMYQMGRDIINGMVKGVVDAAMGLVNAVGNAVGGAIDKGKSMLGINSPSKVFMEFGEGTMEGAEIGVDKGAPSMQRSVALAAKSMIDAYKTTLDSLPPVDVVPTFDRAPTATFAETRNEARSQRRAAETRELVGATAGASGSGRSRLLEGWLRIDESGVAWIEGIAQDVVEENQEFNDNRNGKGRRG